MEEFSIEDFGDPGDFGSLFDNPADQVLGDGYTADDLIAVAQAEQWSPVHSPGVKTSSSSRDASTASSARPAPQPATQQPPSTLPPAVSSAAHITRQSTLGGVSSGIRVSAPTQDPLAALVSAHTATQAIPQATQRMAPKTVSVSTPSGVVQLTREQITALIQQQKQLQQQQQQPAVRAQPVLSGHQPLGVGVVSGQQQTLNAAQGVIASQQVLQQSIPAATNAVNILSDPGKQVLQNTVQANPGQLTLQSIQSALIQATPQVAQRQIIIQGSAAPGTPAQQINLANVQQQLQAQQQGMRLLNVQQASASVPASRPLQIRPQTIAAQSNLLSLNQQGGQLILQRAPVPANNPAASAAMAPQNIVLRPVVNVAATSGAGTVQQYQNIAPQPQSSQFLIAHGGQLRQIQLPADTHGGQLRPIQLPAAAAARSVASLPVQLQPAPATSQTIAPQSLPTGQLQLQPTMVTQAPTTSFTVQGHHGGQVFQTQGSHPDGQTIVSEDSGNKLQSQQSDTSQIGGLHGVNVGNNIQNVNILTSQAQVINVLGAHQSGQKLIPGLTVNLGGQLVNLQNLTGLNINQINQLKEQLSHNSQSQPQESSAGVLGMTTNYMQTPASATNVLPTLSHSVQMTTSVAPDLTSQHGITSVLPMSSPAPGTAAGAAAVSSGLESLAPGLTLTPAQNSKLLSLTPQQIEALRARLRLRQEQQKLEQQKLQEETTRKGLSNEELQLAQLTQPSQSHLQQVVYHTQASLPTSVLPSDTASHMHNMPSSSFNSAPLSKQTVQQLLDANKPEMHVTAKGALDCQSIQPKNEFKGLQDLHASQIKIIGDTIHTIPQSHSAPQPSMPLFSQPSTASGLSQDQIGNHGDSVYTGIPQQQHADLQLISNSMNAQLSASISNTTASGTAAIVSALQPPPVLSHTAHTSSANMTGAALSSQSSTQTIQQLLSAQPASQPVPLSGPNLQVRLQQLMAQLRQSALPTQGPSAPSKSQTTAESLASLLASDDEDEKESPTPVSDSTHQQPSVNVVWGASSSKASGGTSSNPSEASKPVLSRFEQMVPSKVLHHGPGEGVHSAPMVNPQKSPSSQYYKPPTPKQAAAKKIAPKPPRTPSQPPTPSSFKPPTPKQPPTPGHHNFKPPTPTQNFQPPTPTQIVKPPTPGQTFKPPTPGQSYQPTTPNQNFQPHTPNQNFKPPTPIQNNFQPTTPNQNFRPPTPQQPPTPTQNFVPPSPKQLQQPLQSPSYQANTPQSIQSISQPSTPQQAAAGSALINQLQGHFPTGHIQPVPQSQLPNLVQQLQQGQLQHGQVQIGQQLPIGTNQLQGVQQPLVQQPGVSQPQTANAQLSTPHQIQVGNQQFQIHLTPKSKACFQQIIEQLAILQAVPERSEREEKKFQHLTAVHNRIVQYALKQQLQQQQQGQGRPLQQGQQQDQQGQRQQLGQHLQAGQQVGQQLQQGQHIGQQLQQEQSNQGQSIQGQLIQNVHQQLVGQQSSQLPQVQNQPTQQHPAVHGQQNQQMNELLNQANQQTSLKGQQMQQASQITGQQTQQFMQHTQSARPVQAPNQQILPAQSPLSQPSASPQGQLQGPSRLFQQLNRQQSAQSSPGLPGGTAPPNVDPFSSILSPPGTSLSARSPAGSAPSSLASSSVTTPSPVTSQLMSTTKATPIVIEPSPTSDNEIKDEPMVSSHHSASSVIPSQSLAPASSSSGAVLPASVASINGGAVTAGAEAVRGRGGGPVQGAGPDAAATASKTEVFMSVAKQKVEALIENFPPAIKQQLLSQLEAMNPAQKKQFYDTQLVLLLRLHHQQQARKKLLQQKQQQQSQAASVSQPPLDPRQQITMSGDLKPSVTVDTQLPSGQVPSVKVEVKQENTNVPCSPSTSHHLVQTQTQQLKQAAANTQLRAHLTSPGTHTQQIQTGNQHMTGSPAASETPNVQHQLIASQLLQQFQGGTPLVPKTEHGQALGSPQIKPVSHLQSVPQQKSVPQLQTVPQLQSIPQLQQSAVATSQQRASALQQAQLSSSSQQHVTVAASAQVQAASASQVQGAVTPLKQAGTGAQMNVAGASSLVQVQTAGASGQVKVAAAAGQVQVAGPSTAPTQVSGLHRFSRRQLFHLQLNKDQQGALKPDCVTPFSSYKDVIKRLLKYHVLQTSQPSPRHVRQAEAEWEEYARLVQDKTDEMLGKYQTLLLQDSMRRGPSSELVMVERLFLADERAQLLDDRRQATDHPASFKPTPYLPEEEREAEVESESESDESVVCLDDKRESSSDSDGPPTLTRMDTMKELVIKLEPCDMKSPVTISKAPAIDVTPSQRDVTIKAEPDLNGLDTQPVPSPSYLIESGDGLKMRFKASPCPSPAPPHISTLSPKPEPFSPVVPPPVAPHSPKAHFSDISDDDEGVGVGDADVFAPVEAKRARFEPPDTNIESTSAPPPPPLAAFKPNMGSFANQFEQFVREQSISMAPDESSNSSQGSKMDTAPSLPFQTKAEPRDVQIKLEGNVSRSESNGSSIKSENISQQLDDLQETVNAITAQITGVEGLSDITDAISADTSAGVSAATSASVSDALFTANLHVIKPEPTSGSDTPLRRVPTGLQSQDSSNSADSLRAGLPLYDNQLFPDIDLTLDDSGQDASSSLAHSLGFDLQSGGGREKKTSADSALAQLLTTDSSSGDGQKETVAVTGDFSMSQVTSSQSFAMQFSNQSSGESAAMTYDDDVQSAINSILGAGNNSVVSDNSGIMTNNGGLMDSIATMDRTAGPMSDIEGLLGSMGDIGGLGSSEEVLNDVAEVISGLDSDPFSMTQRDEEDLNAAVNSIL